VITRAQTDIMGADPINADPSAPDPFGSVPGPYSPWAAPVMILAGLAADGTPWIWLAGRCGWFIGFERQYDPEVLAGTARKHLDGCQECKAGAEVTTP
jgi:hypothetical protein